MEKNVPFSSVPIGEKIIYQGKEYTRFTYERGKYFVDGKIAFKHIPKHRTVTWVNAWENHLGE